MSAMLVIGAGPSGLAAAALAARAGSDVTLLEASERLGGLATLLAGPLRVNRELARRLGLADHGLELADHPAPVFLPALDGGAGLLLEHDPAAARAELAAHSAPDAEAYAAWRAWLARVGGFVRGVLDAPPPDPFSTAGGDLLSLARTAARLRRLGGDDMLELLRVVPMCAADWLGEHFASPLLRAGLAARASRASVNGPWAPHTAGLLLLAECAGDASVAHPASLAAALAGACEAAGVRIRTNAPVAEILVTRGRAHGVRIEDGEVIETECVLSAADPRTTLLGLVSPRHLEPRVLHELGDYRMRGTTAIVRLALGAPLTYRCRPGEHFAHASLTGDLDDLERAFDAVKYGEFAARPWLEVHATEAGQVTIEAHGAPHGLAGGWNEERRAALGAAVLAQLCRYADVADGEPRSLEVLTPVDIERDHRVAGGHVLHGEPALDQLLFMRPSIACAGHRTPIESLFLCGPGTHPGPSPALVTASLAVRAALG